MKSYSKLFYGFLFLALGAFIIVSQFINLEVTAFTVVLTVLLLAVSLSSLFKKNWFLVVMPSLYAVWINRFWLGINQYLEFLPLMFAGLFLTIGLSLLFKKKYRLNYGKSWKNTSNESIHQNDDIVNLTTSLSSSMQYLYSQNLQSVHINCHLGNSRIYFNQALPSASGVQVIIQCDLGNIELYIPKEWDVHNTVSTSMGSVKENMIYRSVESDNTPSLYLSGNVSMGQIEIIYI